MKTINIILVAGIALFTAGCKKESAATFEQLGKVRFNNKLLDGGVLKIKDGDVLLNDHFVNTSTFILKGGTAHTFSFYDESDQLVLDTTLNVGGSLQEFDLFRPNTSTPIVILSEEMFGLDTEPAPQPGHFKIKVANFLGLSMDLIFSANNDNYVKVPVDTLFDVRNNFSEFYEVAFPAVIDGHPIIGSSWDVFDRDYQMNYGDYGLLVDNSQLAGLRAGRIYVVYLVGDLDFGVLEIKKLYEK